MAQIIPSITSLPVDSSAAPSVEDIQDRLPSICVDYLSHDWSEEDVWASWRSMTRHKHEIANGVRLENASWRTWQKQRNKLKTISPETLNWLKDSDVTWLYGPLHTANVEPVRPAKVSSTGDKYGLDAATKKTKPILKHRTLSEMLTIHNPSSPILEASSRGDDDDVPNMDRPPLVQTKSDTNIVRVRTGGLKSAPAGAAEQEPKAPAMSEQSSADQSVVPDAPSTGKKHISFNTFVEQVIAVDDPSEAQNHQQSSDSEDEMLEIRSNSSRNSSRSSRPSLSRNSSSGSGSGGDHLTIAKIAPTMLKTNGVYHSSLPAMVYAPPAEYRSPEAEQPSFDFPSPKQSKGRTWSEDEDEDYSSVGYDYYSSQQQGAPSHVVRTGASPQNNNTLRPPVPAPNQDSVSTSLSSSTSSSSANLSTSPSQPSRSILKVRPPGAPAKDESPPSPPSSTYFNYNPSAATGIGGMRSSGGYDFVGGSGSPTSPAAIGAVSPGAAGGGGEERGRSTSRSQQTSAYGRSSSGSASVGSASSISPGAPRSHELPTANKQQKTVSQQPSPSLGQVVEGKGIDAEAPLDERMDVDEYSPERSGTPTPHSSPQIVFRPLKDTSPASLPHNSNAQQPQPSASSSSSSQHSRNSNQNQTPSPELPKADPLRVVSPVANTRTTSRATTAHVGTNAAPTIANNSEPTSNSLYRTQSNTQVPPTTGQSTTPAYGQIHRPYSRDQQQQQRGTDSGDDVDGMDEDDDGSSIMGRAANIANTAKDLLGALWYGANDQRNGLRRQGSHT